MNPSELSKQLRLAMESQDFYSEVEKILEILEGKKATPELVRTILKFMEDYPEFDFGSPGSLVHYIETLPNPEYEPELLASLARRPTHLTVWLLNRLINGTKDAAARKKLIDALRQVENHPEADDSAKDRASDFLEYQSS